MAALSAGTEITHVQNRKRSPQAGRHVFERETCMITKKSKILINSEEYSIIRINKVNDQVFCEMIKSGEDKLQPNYFLALELDDTGKIKRKELRTVDYKKLRQAVKRTEQSLKQTGFYPSIEAEKYENKIIKIKSLELKK